MTDHKSAINEACDLLDGDGLGDLCAIISMLATSSRDERRVVFYVTRRLMGKGRSTYGPLNAASDTRDFKHEGGCEAIDALIYWAAEAIKHYRPELDAMEGDQ